MQTNSKDLFYTGAFNQNINIDCSLLNSDNFDNFILDALKKRSWE